jgi:hypothetical protein
MDSMQIYGKGAVEPWAHGAYTVTDQDEEACDDGDLAVIRLK